MADQQKKIIANIDRLNQHLGQAGCSALVLRSGKNFTYLAGFAYPGTLARHLDFPNSPREVVLVWPRRGDSVMILNHYAVPLAQRDSWLQGIEVYDDYADSPYQKMAAVLKRMGLDRETVGFEKTYVSATRWEEIERLLPGVNAIDCTGLMDRVRWIKTSAEVALLEKAADILDEAYLEVFPTVREGETEREVHGRLVESCFRKGAGWVHGILNSHRNTVAYGGEGDMRFQRGDITRNDYVAYHQGYPGHQSRTVVIGQPSQEQKETYRVMLDIYRMTVDRCQVGTKASDIHRFASEKFREHGYQQRLSLAGHSVGAWWHQQEPYIVPGCHQELEEGMVIAMEPHVNYWHLQDMFLITKDGPRLLSPKFSTDEMLVVG